jgi:hypothetical protein
MSSLEQNLLTESTNPIIHSTLTICITPSGHHRYTVEDDTAHSATMSPAQGRSVPYLGGGGRTLSTIPSTCFGLRDHLQRQT